MGDAMNDHEHSGDVSDAGVERPCMHAMCEQIFPDDDLCVWRVSKVNATRVESGTLQQRVAECVRANRSVGLDGPLHLPQLTLDDPDEVLAPCVDCDVLPTDVCLACDGSGRVVLTVPASSDDLY